MEFLPSTLNEWLGMLVQLFSILIAAITLSIKFIRRPLEQDINRLSLKVDEKLQGQGERIGRCESTGTEGQTKLVALDRQVERVELRLMSISEHHGRLEERLQQLARTLETYHEQRLAEDRQMGERLARMETKMEIFNQLNDTLSKLASKL